MNSFDAPHNLVPNWSAEAQTRQHTDSVMHVLVSELIPYTTKPRKQTD
jgi:hypothetical protein